MTEPQLEQLLGGLVDTMQLAADFLLAATADECDQLTDVGLQLCRLEAAAALRRGALEAAAREASTEEFERVNITAASVACCVADVYL